MINNRKMNSTINPMAEANAELINEYETETPWTIIESYFKGQHL